MAFGWTLQNNYDLPGRAKFSGKMKETGNFIWDTAYDSSGNNVTLSPNLNSKSKEFVDKLTTAGEKALIGSSKALIHDKRNQPNTEMREKLLTNMSETFQQSMTNKLNDNFDFNELPCSSRDKEAAKWAKIRMYQERNRRREARRRRQREKEREESRGTQSKRRKSRSKSRKRRKSRKRSTSKKRSKSRSRKKSVRNRTKSRGRSRSKSRKKSRSGSRKRSVKSTGKKRRRSPR